MTARSIADIEAERAVLGCVLLAPGAMPSAMVEVDVSDFHSERHRLVFGVMAELARGSRPIDVSSVASMLDTRGQLARAGGLAALVSLTDAIASAANVTHHARAVRDRARLRRWVDAVGEIARAAPATPDADAFLADAQSRVLSLSEKYIRSEVAPASEWGPRALSRLEERAETKVAPCVSSGFHGLDQALALRRGSLVIIAGRPGSGKTCLGQNIAANVAEAGGRVLFVSIEMSEDELVDRFVARRARVDTRDLARPSALLGTPTWDRVYGALRDLSGLGIDLWCATDVALEDIRARTLRLHALHPIDLIMVDYIQLMRGSGSRGETRNQELGHISRGLKILAKEVNAPVLALSQLNRDVEKRDPPIPVQSDLRDSGSLEQDADFIAMLYRPIVYSPSADPEEAELIFAKVRHGCAGRYRLRFIAAHQRFED